mmetsp:Transcript_41656/g.163588  ORF Transcript_41656/g.163588 Transcript_41656/m.163588 type:complete len:125 (-) Transcript_41656:190-564(-)|eukprot:CAMPEP_0113971702 /NCGR_PEP_ID=MMETSP0011_2-20120614/12558_1 /TAXON_ID=101924 /ORGANISM="Rhodosorus marinus" /LENGTH=124 /DNA_ID=CAMNT_0000987577 /DNA_START=70 /DNA_END=444 /DNA_ORIENTATION=+ /assembly_acc=CAM_ASM_000156
MARVVKKGPKGKKLQLKFSIDCSEPVGDELMEPASLEKFLHDRIKINGKVGQLGDAVVIERDDNKIIVIADSPFSKRYLKYLTKKYLKKQSLRDWCRVVATGKNEYELRYYNISEDDQDEEGAE